jgi:hypothetical protein
MHIFVQESPRLNRSAWVNFGFTYHPQWGSATGD